MADQQVFTVSRTEYGHTFTYETYRDEEGVYRWVTSGNVCPLDACQQYGIDKLPGYDAEVQKRARDAEIEAVVADYVKRRARTGYSAEEIAEMRAAFGPGHTVMDVFTGRTFKL